MKTNHTIIILLMVFMPMVYAGNISLKEVKALEKQCMDAEEPYYDSYREHLIADCEKQEAASRGIIESCTERYKNVRPLSSEELAETPSEIRVVVNPPLPICVKAEEARRKYYGLTHD